MKPAPLLFCCALLVQLWGGSARAQEPPPPASRMRSVGLVGGIAWPSTLDYYRLINQAVNEAYGNNTNPPLLVATVDHHRVLLARAKGDWDGYAAPMTEAALQLQRAGAEAIVLCSNTAHKVIERVAKDSGMTILHIGDATGRAVRKAGLKKVGLIGTQFTMEDGFLRDKLAKEYSIETLVPETREARSELHRITEQELAYDKVLPESKRYVLGQIEALRKAGAEGIILGCTEFPLMIKAADVSIPVFDTTQLHAQMAVDFILGRDSQVTKVSHVAIPVIAPRPEDVGSIDGMLRAWYEVISGPAGQPRDWGRDRTLYMPGLRFVDVGIQDGKPLPRIQDHQAYVDLSDASLVKAGFFEQEIHRVTQRFGPIAHVWSTYESRLSEKGPVIARGINSIELFFDGQRWWIANGVWTDETKESPIPAEFLPVPKQL